jgi:CheY-like chemotaxis protein
MKTLRHPPSRELWKFCMDRLRELRGRDTRERDLANILGFEHSRAVRWKEGQMYVDRAEYLVRLADALDVETMLLVALASGALSQEQAVKQLARPRLDEVSKRRRASAPAKVESADLSADASLYAIDGARLEAASRGVVLLISSGSEGKTELAEVLSRHTDTGGLVAASLPMGMCLADRYRPELVFLDMGLASVHAFETCRVLSGLSSRAQRRCRVVAGTASLTDGIEKPALMAGAAAVVLLPFTQNLFQSELDRLEERLGSRRAARK